MNTVMDKIFHFADALLDPNRIFSRFLFLESDYKAKSIKFGENLLIK